MTTTGSPPSRPTPTPSRRTRLLAGIGVVVVIGVAVFQPWRWFTTSGPEQAAPVQVSSVDVAGGPSQLASEGVPVPGSPNPEVAPTSGTAAVGEPGPTPPVQPMALAGGAFVDGEQATSGTASILQLPDGSRYLRLADFSTRDGPELRVWLTDKSAGGNDWGKYDDGVHLSLGALKGTAGSQDYPIPADANLSAFRSVVIWSDRLNVAVGTAPIGLGT